MNNTKQLPALPDRLSCNPGSPHHVKEIFEHNIGIRVNGGVKVYRRGGAKVYQLAHDGLMLF